MRDGPYFRTSPLPFGLVGHNGSGKSTLLKLLARQQALSNGTIHFCGEDRSRLGARDFARRVAYLPQDVTAANGMTVRELVACGRYPWHQALGRFSDTDRQKVDEALALTHVDSMADRMVDTLSGGERQRAWIAMLVAQDSECLLLDEPTSALVLHCRSLPTALCNSSQINSAISCQLVRSQHCLDLPSCWCSCRY